MRLVRYPRWPKYPYDRYLTDEKKIPPNLQLYLEFFIMTTCHLPNTVVLWYTRTTKLSARPASL